MQITDVEVYVVDPVKGSAPLRAEMPDVWTFTRVVIDAGVHGWGECTSFPGNGSRLIADAIHHLTPWIVGQDAADVPNYQKVLDHPIELGRGELRLSDRPGLGVDLDVERLRAHTIYARPGG